jgi:iron complex outermembrane receptor protein
MDKLELMVGVRNIQEDKEAFNSYFNHGTNTFDTTGTDQEHNFTPYPSVPGNAVAGDDDWDDTIITGSVTYQLTDTNRAYFNYSEGFRSGGFSIRAARGGSDYSFNPEEADQIEIGLKNEFFDGALNLNIAYYQLKREAGQFSSIITLPPGSIPGTTTIINNGAGSESDGWELEGRWVIDDNWSVIFNGGTTDIDNKQFSIACEILDGCAGGDPTGTLRVLGGNDDSRQPEWSGALNVAYTKDIGSGTLYANVGYKKVGTFLLVNTGGGAEQRLFEGGYGQWDARIAYDMELSNGGQVSLSVYGKNLSDEEWREQALFLGGFNTGFQGWGAPRTGFFEVKYSM